LPQSGLAAPPGYEQALWVDYAANAHLGVRGKVHPSFTSQLSLPLGDVWSTFSPPSADGGVVVRERDNAMPSVHVKTLSLGLLLAVGGLLFSGGQPPPVWSQDQPCTLATLHGIYMFAYQGFLIQNDQQTPTAYAGRETYTYCISRRNLRGGMHLRVR
jgi:hypothetical protein